MPAITQGCHPPGSAAPLPGGVRQVALIGMPNTGKSTLYNKLTGGRAHVANWPGLTVDLLRGELPADAFGNDYQLVDLPGIHDLKGSSEDEAIVRRYLATAPPDLIVLVINSSRAATQLHLALELRAAGLPFIVALNMSDEAARFGVEVNGVRLSEDLQVPVVPISARNGRGCRSSCIRFTAWRRLPFRPLLPSSPTNSTSACTRCRRPACRHRTA